MKKINIFYEDISPFSLPENNIIKSILFLISEEKRKAGEISIILCSDEYLLKINEQFLNHRYYTDIITFDYVENEIISGDLFISIDRIKENAKKFQTTFINELYRVIFHGILHLIGYNDKEKTEIKQMREKETFYLNFLENEKL